VTVIYVIFRVPVSAVLSLALALLMNQQLAGRRLFRTIYYLPAVIPLVAVSMMWIWIFNPEYGVLNSFIRLFGIEGPQWIHSSRWALPALIIMSLWQVGTGMVIFLAGLQGIPAHLYEAATIDGANTWQRFLKVTLPMLSPVVLFALVMNVIGSFQIFTQAYIMTQGGPGNATLFLVLYIYRNAFEWFHMGYASALAWVLFLVVLVISLAMLRSSEHWVHYEGRTGGA
ncbi:MAG: sugar ABC transporter permease, partial [Caldilineaceae bacterium]|nr:sugar ABC transporter permease [Caldilineaceae bacterium]